VLAYFDTSGVSNGGTEAINLIIEKVRRLAHGFKNFDHYRLRIMLAADGRRHYRTHPNHANSEDPHYLRPTAWAWLAAILRAAGVSAAGSGVA
jgi:hypothetical protein